MRTSQLIAIVAAFAVPFQISAVEGGLGRPVSGTQVQPFAAVVPPAPGLILSVEEIFYSGDIGAQRAVPIANFLTVDLDGTFSFTPLTAVYIWNTGTNKWNFASSVTLP